MVTISFIGSDYIELFCVWFKKAISIVNQMLEYTEYRLNAYQPSEAIAAKPSNTPIRGISFMLPPRRFMSLV